MLLCLFNDSYQRQTLIASGQLPEFIRNDQWPPDAPESWTTMSGRNVVGLLQDPSKTQINHRTRRSVAGDLTACHMKRSTRLLKASHYD